MPLSCRTPSADLDHHQVRVTWENEEVLMPSHSKGLVQGRQGELKERETPQA